MAQRKIWHPYTIGTSGLITHGGANWKATGRRTLAQMPPQNGLCAITNGLFSERSGMGLREVDKMSKPEHKRVLARTVAPNEHGSNHDRFMFKCMFDHRPWGNL